MRTGSLLGDVREAHPKRITAGRERSKRVEVMQTLATRTLRCTDPFRIPKLFGKWTEFEAVVLLTQHRVSAPCRSRNSPSAACTVPEHRPPACRREDGLSAELPTPVRITAIAPRRYIDAHEAIMREPSANPQLVPGLEHGRR